MTAIDDADRHSPAPSTPDRKAGDSAARPRARYPWALVLALGPVTGRLTALYLQNVRAKQMGLAAICLAGIVSFWFLGPKILSSELKYLHAHQGRPAACTHTACPH